MFYDARKRDHGLAVDPLKSLLVPRPIGWISTIDRQGRVNLAPYSFYNGVGEFPPMVYFAITGTYGGFPVDATVALRAWVDPALRTQVRTHQVLTTRQPFASTSDTTSELVGVTPA